MDTLAHGLWGGVAFGRDTKKKFGWAFLLGMMPDFLSFGPFFVLWAINGFPNRTPGEPPDPSLIPAYVYHAYNVTHSIVVWVAAALLLRKITGAFPWVFAAWLLHILCDIPTHTTKFFPTPYLWPLPTPYVDGFSWGQRWFMMVNYSVLAVAYLVFYFRRR